MKNKKSIMGPIISVFVMVLVIAILAGLTFLFVAQLKTQAIDVSPRTTLTVTEEELSSANLAAGVAVAGASSFDANAFVVTEVLNATDDAEVGSGNVTITSAGVASNASSMVGYADGFKVSYTYSYISPEDAQSYDAINTTESAGAGLVGYLPLIFLALIFGAILTIVLKIILPYINLGKEMGGF